MKEDIKMKEIKDIIYDNYNNKLDMYLPDNINFKTIIYFHGGGLKEGDKYSDNIYSFALSFTKNGYAFVSVNYRMYPIAHFPDYLVDAANSIKYISENINKYDGSSDLIISGQSAGAWIALMLAMNKEYLKEVGIDSTKIYSFIIESAEPTSHFNVMQYEKNLDIRLQRIDEYAPLYYLDKDTDFNSMLLIYYSDDMLIRKYQNILFYQAVKQFNNNLNIKPLELEGMHCKGSIEKDETGEYPFVKVTLEFLNSLK